MDRDGRPSISLQDLEFMDGTIGKRSFWHRVKEDPLVPLGCLVTAGILFGGLGSFVAGSSRVQNHFMKARLVAQGATVAAMMTGAVMATKVKGNNGDVKGQVVKYEDKMKIVLSKSTDESK